MSTERRRALPLVLIVIGSLVAFLAILAIWANRQLLNTDNWTNTSTELLQRQAVRDQLATLLVDQLYDNTNVTETVREALPPRAEPLAGAAAGGLRALADRGVRRALTSTAVENAWEEANRRAHRRLIQVVDGGGDNVSTANGNVTVDLRGVLLQAADRVGARDKLEGRLPPNAAQLTVLRSKQLSAIQDGVKILRHLPIVLVGLMLGLFALAIWRGRGWRREALRACGFGLLLAGLLVLVATRAGTNVAVDSLARTTAAEPAVRDTLDVATSLLRQAAGAAVLYGIVIVLGAWLAGPTSAAVGLRAAAAPYLREPWYAWGGLAVVALLVAWWGPTPATRNPILGLLLLAFLALGLEALRRQVAREHPDVDREAAATLRAANGQRVTNWGRGLFSRDAPAARPAGDASIDQLARLGDLHETGVLDDDEFARAKAAVLDRRGVPVR